jgi:hypothetical protein
VTDEQLRLFEAIRNRALAALWIAETEDINFWQAWRSTFLRGDAASDSKASGQRKNEHDQQNQAKSTTAIEGAASVVAPATDDEDDEDDQDEHLARLVDHRPQLGERPEKQSATDKRRVVRNGRRPPARKRADAEQHDGDNQK